MKFSFARKLASEFLGTAILLAVVVGSGIMGEKLANGNAAIALLANAIATGAGLTFLILSFGSISGAHFNPAVTITEALNENLSWRAAVSYSAAQIAGAFCGVALANLMFQLPVYFVSTKSRLGSALFLSEFVATFGLIAVIKTGVKFHPRYVFLMVAAYITAAYWFTASTSFANPAVTLARSVSDTFAGIAPASVPSFIAAQMLGAIAAHLFFKWLLTEEKANV